MCVFVRKKALKWIAEVLYGLRAQFDIDSFCKIETKLKHFMLTKVSGTSRRDNYQCNIDECLGGQSFSKLQKCVL